MPLAWIALNSVKGLGPVRIKQLLEHLGTPENILAELKSGLPKAGWVPDSCIGQLRDGALLDDARRQLETAGKLGVSVITLSDERYPFYLKEIFAPPPVLYVKGDLSVFRDHAVAVVGTRAPSPYGRKVASLITGSLAQNRLVIVSGLARGIDTVSHTACLQAGGRTVAVLGSGVDHIYPAENRALAEQITERGALVSEFPLSTRPESYNFPRRNRIISGLSAGVLVVEAAAKSGALITAHYALQQGREVFAVPGPITSPLSDGTLNLIKQGATPVRSGDDIVESLRMITHHQVMSGPAVATTSMALELLPEAEQKVYSEISEVPKRIDELLEGAGNAVPDLFGSLLNLELKGLIRQLSGQQFVRA